MESINSIQKDKIVEDAKVLIADAEEMMRLLASQAGENMGDVHRRLQVRIDKAKADLVDVQTAAINKAKEVGCATDKYVHEEPWKAIGVAAAIGAVAALLVSRR